jgi:hypothetical protein|tara:strand:- start:136 stop:273 length:138 start_codon:yes stop_codon:yes gene_type:complete
MHFDLAGLVSGIATETPAREGWGGLIETLVSRDFDILPIAISFTG